MRPAGHPVDPGLITSGDFEYGSGLAAGRRLLDRDDRPTAIFASSDQMAFGVCEAARRRGLSVPDDLSVVGFDSLPEARWSSARARPAGPDAAAGPGTAVLSVSAKSISSSVAARRADPGPVQYNGL